MADTPTLARMLRTMILIREFDERAIALRVAGKIYGAVHPYVGQEAVAVGVCASLTVREALAVADELAREGIEVEVIDPRTLVPLDVDTLHASARKTGRVVIVDEAPATCSAASEIAALIVEDPETFRALKASVRRVCAAPVPVPYSPTLEGAALPSREDIKTAVYEVLKESLRPAGQGDQP